MPNPCGFSNGRRGITLGQRRTNALLVVCNRIHPDPSFLRFQAVSQSGFREFHRRFQAKNEGYLTNFLVMTQPDIEGVNCTALRCK